MLREPGAGKAEEGVKRKDSGCSISTMADGEDESAPKTRDFALQEMNTSAHAKMNTPKKAASSPIVTVKASKDNGSVWRRMRVTVSKLGGKA